MREFDRDLIRGGHYGQRSHVFAPVMSNHVEVGMIAKSGNARRTPMVVRAVTSRIFRSPGGRRASRAACNFR
jgi:hypothetical protein